MTNALDTDASHEEKPHISVADDTARRRLTEEVACSSNRAARQRDTLWRRYPNPC